MKQQGTCFNLYRYVIFYQNGLDDIHNLLNTASKIDSS